ncbi:MAG: dephospho-CoA kinase [Bacteroidia bacterium]
MIKLGITGGIGSGKSTVCKVFELLGVPVYYADDEGKKLLDVTEVKEKILKIFGNAVLSENKMIDRKKLSELVFNDKEKLEKLNSIIHPAVGIHFEEWLKEQKECTYIVKEAAILFESGAYKQVDDVITVTAPQELKIKRAMNRSGITREEVLERINNQMDDEEKIRRSKYKIVNDEEHLIIPQILSIHRSLTSEK